ncbi:MAG: FecR family protein [Leptospiraceae bacterium]|nr:FecR family protein [Leptospiraceae bacterium]
MKAFKLIILLTILFLSCEDKSKEKQISSPPPVEEKIPVLEKLESKIIFLNGKVKIFRNEKEIEPVKDMNLELEDIIITGNPGTIEIQIGEFSAIKVAKNTKVNVSRFLVDGKEEANVNLDFGKVLSVVNKSKKDQEFKMNTPSALAGVRGTSFLTIVENKDDKAKDKSCSKEDCRVKIIVSSGTVSVQKKNDKEEIILEKNSQVSIKDDTEISSEIIKPMSKDSVKQIKELLAFHKSEFQGFQVLEEELEENTKELERFKSTTVEETKKTLKRKEFEKSKADEVIQETKNTEKDRYLKKEIHKDKLKLDRNE